MSNKLFTRIGLIIIIATIICDVIFYTKGSQFQFSLLSAFLLGIINMQALYFIKTIFKFEITKEDLIGLAFVYQQKELLFLLGNRSIKITFKNIN